MWDSICPFLGIFVLCTAIVGSNTTADDSNGIENRIKVTPIVNNRTGLVTAAAVEGVFLPALSKEDFNTIRNLIAEYTILIFKNQGALSDKQLRDVGLTFGPSVNSRHAHFFKAPHKEVNVASNDRNHGLTSTGEGWHIDGYWFKEPHAYVIYQEVNITRAAPTMFVPLTEIVAALPGEKFAQWDRVWTKSRTGEGVFYHPFIYEHPTRGKKTICIHSKYASDVVFDYGSPDQRQASPEEKSAFTQEWMQEFDKEDGYWHYIHHWEYGDVIITDNLAVAHQTPKTAHKPMEEIGLRVLKTVCIQGQHQPMKSLQNQPDLSSNRDEL